MKIQLLLQKDHKVTPLSFTVDKMVNAGFTGRNQEEVKHHLEELSAKGIDVPDSTPTLYPVIPSALTTETVIEVYGEETSGEIEYVLFVKDDKEIYVGIGSDHTDRKLEELDIPRAKQITPNLISPMVWELSDLLEHWDDLSMECSVKKGADTIFYQKGGLGLLMSPSELMELISQKIKGPLNNIVIFSGTVKMETEDFVFADTFSGLLSDPTLNRSIEFSYAVKPMNYMK
ncbi:MAG: DUF2848 family protein [Deltaproteobacteria bacterium]|uniref:DUF2848 family protein n=1 Tax=Desulfobacula sp. TaxID=2593537 RepID=UPI00198A836E|nr:DUF2848 family protein [Candidatus Desulfobacula maris]MBL6995527.1 DUF2848 family protein [Desulfobacula sp.]